MKPLRWLGVWSLMLSLLAHAAPPPPSAASSYPLATARFTVTPERWVDWKPVPDAEGFAGSFAGLLPLPSETPLPGKSPPLRLLLAGGANIVGPKWGSTMQKQWYDGIYTFAVGERSWQRVGTLPRPLGYGVFATVPEGVICAGGSNSTGHFADAFLLYWHEGTVRHRPLPPLPRPCANTSCAVVGDTLYVAGGLESPTATTAMHTFWALDLRDLTQPWRELPPWPGPERMLAVAGSDGRAFYLFSGASLQADTEGKPVRTYLRDAYRYTPEAGWQKLADLPRPAVAAPSPAPRLGKSELLVISGDDGQQVNFTPLEQHPGFPRDILVYDLQDGSWRAGGAVPISRATTPVVSWGSLAFLLNGEVRPRVRTPAVQALNLADR